MSNCCSHGALLHFSLQICYYHQDLHRRLFRSGLCQKLHHNLCALLLTGENCTSGRASVLQWGFGLRCRCLGTLNPEAKPYLVVLVYGGPLRLPQELRITDFWACFKFPKYSGLRLHQLQRRPTQKTHRPGSLSLTSYCSVGVV